jgi:diacylglycerol kinase family enzyme
MASCGFDAEVVAAVRPLLKRRVGRLAFAWAICERLWRYRDHRLTVSADGVEYRATTVIATNGSHYAGPFVVAPHANLAEPVLDLLLFQRSGRPAVLGYLLGLLCNRLAARRDVILLRCRCAVITADRSVPVQADGELIGQLPVSLSVAETALRLLRP